MLKNLAFAFVAVALSASALPALAAPPNPRAGFAPSGEDAFRNDLLPTDTATASTAAWCGHVLAAPGHYNAGDVTYCRAVMRGS
jgi:hypothetical protein